MFLMVYKVKNPTDWIRERQRRVVRVKDGRIPKQKKTASLITQKRQKIKIEEQGRIKIKD